MASSWSRAARSRRGCPPSTARWPCCGTCSSPRTPVTEVGPRGWAEWQPGPHGPCTHHKHCRPLALSPPPHCVPCLCLSPSLLVSQAHFITSGALAPGPGDTQLRVTTVAHTQSSQSVSGPAVRPCPATLTLWWGDRGSAGRWGGGREPLSLGQSQNRSCTHPREVRRELRP